MCVSNQCCACNRGEMTVLAGNNEELQQELDAAKKSLKDNARTRRRLDKVLQDATFAVQSMLTVSVKLTKYCLSFTNTQLLD